MLFKAAVLSSYLQGIFTMSLILMDPTYPMGTFVNMCNLLWDIKEGERSNGTSRILTWAAGWTATMFAERGACQQEWV